MSRPPPSKHIVTRPSGRGSHFRQWPSNRDSRGRLQYRRNSGGFQGREKYRQQDHSHKNSNGGSYMYGDWAWYNGDDQRGRYRNDRFRSDHRQPAYPAYPPHQHRGPQPNSRTEQLQGETSRTFHSEQVSGIRRTPFLNRSDDRYIGNSVQSGYHKQNGSHAVTTAGNGPNKQSAAVDPACPKKSVSHDAIYKLRKEMSTSSVRTGPDRSVSLDRIPNETTSASNFQAGVKKIVPNDLIQTPSTYTGEGSKTHKNPFGSWSKGKRSVGLQEKIVASRNEISKTNVSVQVKVKGKTFSPVSKISKTNVPVHMKSKGKRSSPVSKAIPKVLPHERIAAMSATNMTVPVQICSSAAEVSKMADNNGGLTKGNLVQMAIAPRSVRDRKKITEMVRNHSRVQSKRAVSLANLRLAKQPVIIQEPIGEVELENLPAELQLDIAGIVALDSETRGANRNSGRSQLTLPDKGSDGVIGKVKRLFPECGEMPMKVEPVELSEVFSSASSVSTVKQVPVSSFKSRTTLSESCSSNSALEPFKFSFKADSSKSNEQASDTQCTPLETSFTPNKIKAEPFSTPTISSVGKLSPVHRQSNVLNGNGTNFSVSGRATKPDSSKLTWAKLAWSLECENTPDCFKTSGLSDKDSLSKLAGSQASPSSTVFPTSLMSSPDMSVAAHSSRSKEIKRTLKVQEPVPSTTPSVIKSLLHGPSYTGKSPTQSSVQTVSSNLTPVMATCTWLSSSLSKKTDDHNAAVNSCQSTMSLASPAKSRTTTDSCSGTTDVSALSSTSLLSPNIQATKTKLKGKKKARALKQKAASLEADKSNSSTSPSLKAKTQKKSKVNRKKKFGAQGKKKKPTGRIQAGKSSRGAGRKSGANNTDEESGALGYANQVLQLSVKEDSVRKNVTAISSEIDMLQRIIVSYQMKLAMLSQKKIELENEERKLRSERMKILQDAVSGGLQDKTGYRESTGGKGGCAHRQPTQGSANLTPPTTTTTVTSCHSGHTGYTEGADLVCAATELSTNIPPITTTTAATTVMSGHSGHTGYKEGTNSIDAAILSVIKQEPVDIPQPSVSSEQTSSHIAHTVSGPALPTNLSTTGEHSSSSELSSVERPQQAGETSSFELPQCSEATEVQQKTLPKKKAARKKQTAPKGCEKAVPLTEEVQLGANIMQDRLGLMGFQLPEYYMQYMGTLTPGDDKSTIITKLADGVISSQITDLTQALSPNKQVDQNGSSSGHPNKQTPKKKDGRQKQLAVVAMNSQITDLTLGLSPNKQMGKNASSSEQPDKQTPKKKCATQKKLAEVMINSPITDFTQAVSPMKPANRDGSSDKQTPKKKAARKKKLAADDQSGLVLSQDMDDPKSKDFFLSCIKEISEAGESAELRKSEQQEGLVSKTDKTSEKSNQSSSSVESGRNVRFHRSYDPKEDTVSFAKNPESEVNPSGKLKSVNSVLDTTHDVASDSEPVAKLSLSTPSDVAHKRRHSCLDSGPPLSGSTTGPTDSSSNSQDGSNDHSSNKIPKIMSPPVTVNETHNGKKNAKDVLLVPSNKSNTAGDVKLQQSSSSDSCPDAAPEVKYNVTHGAAHQGASGDNGETVIIDSDSETGSRPITSVKFAGPDLCVSEVKVYKGHVYVCYNGCRAKRFDLKTDACVDYSTGSVLVQCMAITNKGCDSRRDRLFLGGEGQTLLAFNAETGAQMESHRYCDAIRCFHCRWGHIFIGLANGGVLILDLKENKSVGAYRCADRAIAALSSATEGVRKVLCVAAEDFSIGVFDASSGVMLRTLGGHVAVPTSMQAHSGWLYSGASDGRVMIHNICSGELETILAPGGGYVSALTYVQVDGKFYLLTASYNKLIFCYNLQMRKLVQVYYGAGFGVVTSLTVFKDLIITGNREGLVESCPFRPAAAFPCLADQCGYVFGLEEHRTHHMRSDHQRVPCSWKNCQEWLPIDNNQIDDHMTRHLIKS